MVITQNKTNIVSNKTIDIHRTTNHKVSEKGYLKDPEEFQWYTCRAIVGLRWYIMAGIIMYKTPDKDTDKIMLCSQTNHCHAVKGML